MYQSHKYPSVAGRWRQGETVEIAVASSGFIECIICQSEFSTIRKLEKLQIVYL